MRDFNFLRYPIAKRKVQQILGSIDGPVKLNVGCGTDYKDGWINIDNNSDENIEKLDLNWDLRFPLPFGDNSVDFIFNEHFIEHLTVEEGQSAIKDLMRVLRPGGVMRIATPDLQGSIYYYNNVEIEDDPTIKEFQLFHIKTKAERINISFRSWGHKWLYDWDELERRLEEAGCTKIKRCKLHKSKHSELKNLEIRRQSDLIAEVTK